MLKAYQGSRCDAGLPFFRLSSYEKHLRNCFSAVRSFQSAVFAVLDERTKKKSYQFMRRAVADTLLSDCVSQMSQFRVPNNGQLHLKRLSEARGSAPALEDQEFC